MSKKYYINTYGCQMNVHESEKLAGMLEQLLFIATDNIVEADVIVFNTCCIRETAESKVIGNIGEIKILKKTNPNLIFAICGCMTQKDGTAIKLQKKFPFIDLIFGTHNMHKLRDFIINGKGIKTIEIIEDSPNIIEDIPIARTSGINAWVNIIYGCNNYCTYCIVPYVRGREKSRKNVNILSDIKKLIEDGYKEITLLGQNVNSYNDGECDFKDLLEKISQIEGEFIVKFMTSHPKDLSEEVVMTISKSNKFAKYIHLPVQSGSTNILHKMNRKYSREDYINKINMIRKQIPGIGLSTDIMVGFPGETDEDFAETVSLLELVKFNNVFPFMYSKRSGTLANGMENQIDISIKRDRIKKIIALQKVISRENAIKIIGKIKTVLCHRIKNNFAECKTSCEKVVTIENPPKDIEHKFLKVEITGAKNSKLIGKLLEVL